MSHKVQVFVIYEGEEKPVGEDNYGSVSSHENEWVEF